MCLEQLPFQRCERAGNVSTQCLGSSAKAAAGAHAVEDLKSPIHFFDLPSLNPTLQSLLPSSAGLPLLRNHHLGNQRKPKSQRPLFLPEWFPSVPFLPVAVTICLCETGEQVDADKDALLSSRKYARTLADAKSLGVFCVEMVTCTYETRWGVFVEIWCWGLVVFRCSFLLRVSFVSLRTECKSTRRFRRRGRRGPGEHQSRASRSLPWDLSLR